MKAREKAYKMLLEANIVNDLKDVNMINRIAEVLEKVILERNTLQDYKSMAVLAIEKTDGMKDNIRNLLDGKRIACWEGEDE